MVPPLKFVAIHLGAGNGTLKDDPTLINFAKQACEKVMTKQYIPPESRVNCCDQYCQTILKEQTPGKNDTSKYMTAREGVVQLIKILEDYPPLNCGYGSNLTMRGEVECDASLMSDDDMIWTGIGAVSGCRNPIVLAKSIYDHTRLKRPLNLVQPNILVGSGAKEWMRKHCPGIYIADSKLVSPKSLDSYQKYKSRYDHEYRNNQDPSLNKSVMPAGESGNTLLDTVGAVAIDHNGHIATAVSSGGIVLKHKGRLGQAAIPGAGCWAETGAAVTSTGVGEYLIMSMFARKIHDALSKNSGRSFNSEKCDNISRSLVSCFKDLAEAPSLAHVPTSQRFAGFLSVHIDRVSAGGGSNIFLSYGHNTSSLCIGYMSSDDKNAHSFESRLNTDGKLAEVNTISI